MNMAARNHGSCYQYNQRSSAVFKGVQILLLRLTVADDPSHHQPLGPNGHARLMASSPGLLGGPAADKGTHNRRKYTKAEQQL
jgi:hypothetical protein